VYFFVFKKNILSLKNFFCYFFRKSFIFAFYLKTTTKIVLFIIYVYLFEKILHKIINFIALLKRK